MWQGAVLTRPSLMVQGCEIWMEGSVGGLHFEREGGSTAFGTSSTALSALLRPMCTAPIKGTTSPSGLPSPLQTAAASAKVEGIMVTTGTRTNTGGWLVLGPLCESRIDLLSDEIDAYCEMVQGGSPRSSNRALALSGVSVEAHLWSPYESATIEQTRGAGFVTRVQGCGREGNHRHFRPIHRCLRARR